MNATALLTRVITGMQCLCEFTLIQQENDEKYGANHNEPLLSDQTRGLHVSILRWP